MLDRAWSGSFRKSLRRGRRPLVEALEGRTLLAASLATIAPVTVPATLGYQVPLNGAGTTDNQTFTVASSNPDIKATVAQGKFLTFNITHTAVAGNASDVSFAGSITYQLFDDLTPLTASRIESFVTSGFYNGKIYHRIASGFPGTSDFIFQGGSLSGTGAGKSGQPGTPFPDEFVQQLAFTGVNQLAMANSGPDTNDTQFFHTTGSPVFLNFHHNIFAELVSDPNNILPQFEKVALSGTTPASPITINKASLSTTNPNGVVHVDATGAKSGESATITVTATDTADNSTTSQAFTVNTVADTQVERPFIPDLSKSYPIGTGTSTVTGSPIPFYQQTIGLNQVDTFAVPDVVPTPGDQVTYTVQGDVNASGAFTAVQNGTATINQSTGIVTLTPTAGFSGTIDLLVGVRDQTNRANAATLDDPGNYQYQRFRVTVNPTATPVAILPIAGAVTQQVLKNQAATVQLKDIANPSTAAPNTQYVLLSQPSLGSIANFNASTGSFTYNAPNTLGPVTFQYDITSTSPAGNAVTSNAATVTLNVSNTLTPTPIAAAVTQAVTSGTDATIQLLGQANNPANPTETLTYAITSQPTIGTLSNFNPTTGTVTYSTQSNTFGVDTFQYTVTTVDASGNVITSTPGKVTLNVSTSGTFVNTGAVRLINNVLVVTPVPSLTKTPNQIAITEANDPADTTKNVIQVTINGQTDLIQPTVASLTEIVVFGSKKSDNIRVDPLVDPSLPVTLDGGHKGNNLLIAGAGTTILHGWFGSNTLVGGLGDNQMIGRAGHVKFQPSATTTLIFAGQPHSMNKKGHAVPPGGTFYKLKKGHIVAIPTPTGHAAKTTTTHHKTTTTTTTTKKK